MRPSRAITLVAVLCCSCSRPPDKSPESKEPQKVPGVESAMATADEVADVFHAFGTVTVEGEPPEVRDARTQLVEAEARQRLAAQQVERLEALAKGAVAPRKELDAARAELAGAQAAAARARQVLASFGTDSDHSPITRDETWVIAHVMQSDLGHVRAHAPARFTADAFADRAFDGTVDAAPGYVDPATRTAPARLRVQDSEHVLRPGMTGAVSIDTGQRRPAVFVPSAAVVYDGTQAVVFVEEGEGTYTPHPVRLGITQPGKVEVIGGLTAGTRVATTGAASLLSEARLPAGGSGN